MSNLVQCPVCGNLVPAWPEFSADHDEDCGYFRTIIEIKNPPFFAVDADAMDMIRIVERDKPDPFKQVKAYEQLVYACINLLRRADRNNSALWVEAKLDEILTGVPDPKAILDVPQDLT